MYAALLAIVLNLLSRDVTCAQGERQTSDLPDSGLLFFATYRYRDNAEATKNPYITGALLSFHWSQIEESEGEYNWSDVDDRMKLWVDAGKKVALRIVWSANGMWLDPWAKHPTPQWVWDEGAAMAFSEDTKTEVPLQWGPIYKKHAFAFIQEMARHYDGNPNVLFVDVSPGGETNPYRGSINRRDTKFKEIFSNTTASDGTKYSDDLWVATVKEYIDRCAEAFKRAQIGVTLNRGSLQGPERFVEIGEYAVSEGLYVGQNGLSKNSYLRDSSWRRAFAAWDPRTKFYFEMVARSGSRTGTLMEVMKAAERIHCSYLGVYPEDVLKGTKGQKNYDPEFEAALKYGASIIGKPVVIPSGVK